MTQLVRKKKAELFGVRIQPVAHELEVSSAFSDLTTEFSDVFVEELPDRLPLKRELEFEINLKFNEPPPVRPVIRLSS